MRLSFIRSHKSIRFLPVIELPDFVVLTGINGAGKSHLLEAIESGLIQIDDIEFNKQTRPVRRFDWMNLIPQDTGAFAAYQITQERSNFWNEISQHINEFRPQLLEELRQLNRAGFDKLKPREIVGITPEDLIKTGSTPEQANELVQAIQNIASSASQNVANRFTQNDPSTRGRLISLLQSNTNVPLVAFEESDFYDYFPRSWQPVDMFQQSFGRLFAGYQQNWLNNRIRFVANSEGEPVSFLTDIEFLNKYGEPPWEFVNSVLETANLDFRINQPPRYEDRPYEPILTDQVTGSEVKFNDLSSGERILMSFALCLYYAGDARQMVNYPRVLLFDEIDAPLHPSMTQSLLRTIQEVLVNKHGIKVILTTHSPSTVALSNEDSLYVMHKTDERRIQKTTKDRALAILTTGVPTISINYENRRQVFVESKYDVTFYEMVYEKLRDKLVPEISINFISSGVSGQGSCEQVKEIVNTLTRYGNHSIYGIIDWDTRNTGNEFVKVLGKDRRYSIENYIFDPILLVAFLLREKFIDRTQLSLEEGVRYTDFSNFENAKLQSVADFIVNQTRLKVRNSSDDYSLEIEYVCGRKINLPLWFLRIQGHELESIIKELFPQLNRYQREGELKREVITKVIDDIPDFISKDVLTVLSEIQNYQGVQST